MATVTKVETNGNWQGVYVDGNLVHENHRVEPLEHVDVADIDKQESVWVFKDGRSGSLPDTLEGIQESDAWRYDQLPSSLQ